MIKFTSSCSFSFSVHYTYIKDSNSFEMTLVEFKSEYFIVSSVLLYTECKEDLLEE